MPTTTPLRAALFAVLSAAVLCPAAPATAEVRTSKDVGPSSATCDHLDKGTPAWMTCAGSGAGSSTSAGVMGDTELFYAGYWLAKTGRYQDALGYLQKATVKDERVLTYIGFATRKLGDVDGALPYYEQAIARNPQYSVARAYMGEAFLTKNEPAKAAEQLSEIERRCGRSCAPYTDLAAHIAEYEAGNATR